MQVWRHTGTGWAATEATALAELAGHYLVCGWNRTTGIVVRELRASEQTRNCAVVMVCELPAPPELVLPEAPSAPLFFVAGDYTSTAVLNRVQLGRARRALLLADRAQPRSDQDRDARTVLAALTIEKLNPAIYTCAELLNPDNTRVLELAAVDEYLVGDLYVGNVIGHATRAGGVVQLLDELLSANRGNSFYKVRVPADLVGQPFAVALGRYKETHDALIVGVEDPVLAASAEVAVRRRAVITNPAADHVLVAGENLIVIGLTMAAAELTE